MPKCIVCGTQFYDASYYDPAEDCACGENLSQDEGDDLDPQDIQDMRDSYTDILRETIDEFDCVEWNESWDDEEGDE